MEVPQARWMVDVMENPIYKWMTIGGTPILGNPNMGNDPSIDCRSLFAIAMVIQVVLHGAQ